MQNDQKTVDGKIPTKVQTKPRLRDPRTAFGNKDEIDRLEKGGVPNEIYRFADALSRYESYAEWRVINILKSVLAEAIRSAHSSEELVSNLADALKRDVMPEVTFGERVQRIISVAMDNRISVEERERAVLTLVSIFNKLVDHFSRDGSVLTHLSPEEYGPTKYANEDVYTFRWMYQILYLTLEQRPCHAKQSETALDAIRAAVRRIDDLRAIADRK